MRQKLFHLITFEKFNTTIKTNSNEKIWIEINENDGKWMIHHPDVLFNGRYGSLINEITSKYYFNEQYNVMNVAIDTTVNKVAIIYEDHISEERQYSPYLVLAKRYLGTRRVVHHTQKNGLHTQNTVWDSEYTCEFGESLSEIFEKADKLKHEHWKIYDMIRVITQIQYTSLYEKFTRDIAKISNISDIPNNLKKIINENMLEKYVNNKIKP